MLQDETEKKLAEPVSRQAQVLLSRNSKQKSGSEVPIQEPISNETSKAEEDNFHDEKTPTSEKAKIELLLCKTDDQRLRATVP